jgi:tetratricopeptide (TPR) repeat protein
MVMAVSGVVETSAPARAADDRTTRAARAGRHARFVPSITGDQGAQTSEALRAEAFTLAYNLDHEPAIALLRRAVEVSPDDPGAHRSLASVLWLNILFKRGAVTVDHYMGSLSRARVDLEKPPPELDAEFRKHVDRAIALAEQQVKASPKSAQAHYELGASVGLRASYVATVEGKLLAGFKAARRSFDAHERVLELDPSRKEAGLIVGTYRYVVSSLSLPMRLMAYVAGFGGDRDKAIAMLEMAATSTESRTDAMFALILVYNRERRFDEALRVLEQLRRLYPKNRLVVLEHGSTALRAGRAQQAETILTEGLAMLAKDSRPRIPGEEGLWRYKRGAARVALGQAEAAMVDLQLAVKPDSQRWVSGRARIELGRLALARGDRETARNEARQATVLCEQGNDPACEDEASRLLRRANGR